MFARLFRATCACLVLATTVAQANAANYPCSGRKGGVSHCATVQAFSLALHSSFNLLVLLRVQLTLVTLLRVLAFGLSDAFVRVQSLATPT